MDYNTLYTQLKSQAKELANWLMTQPLTKDVKEKLIEATQSSYPTGPIKFVGHIKDVNTVPVCKLAYMKGAFLDVAVLEKTALLVLATKKALLAHNDAILIETLVAQQIN